MKVLPFPFTHTLIRSMSPRSFPHVCSCFQNSTRFIVQYRHSHIYCLHIGIGGFIEAACQRPSHFAASALTSSTISRHALRSTLSIPLPVSTVALHAITGAAACCHESRRSCASLSMAFQPLTTALYRSPCATPHTRRSWTHMEAQGLGRFVDFDCGSLAGTCET